MSGVPVMYPLSLFKFKLISDKSGVEINVQVMPNVFEINYEGLINALLDSFNMYGDSGYENTGKKFTLIIMEVLRTAVS